ncbi:hypothetical protein AZF37_09840 (plasmid) [endosymbiont 'TC1' of Trimyema compressum]|nr:hypothetical protein AZF37_09840 [endosymbiont 'TC1' of Trimyema compressum]
MAKLNFTQIIKYIENIFIYKKNKVELNYNFLATTKNHDLLKCMWQKILWRNELKINTIYCYREDYVLK